MKESAETMIAIIDGSALAQGVPRYRSPPASLTAPGPMLTGRRGVGGTMTATESVIGPETQIATTIADETAP